MLYLPMYYIMTVHVIYSQQYLVHYFGCVVLVELLNFEDSFV